MPDQLFRRRKDLAPARAGRRVIFIAILLGVLTAGNAQETKSQVDSMLNTLNDTTTIPKGLNATQAPTILNKRWNKINTKWFTLNIGFCVLVDHNILKQDDVNIAQVGKVEAATEFRADRFILSGNLLFFKNPWRYMISANYNGLDAPQGKKTFDFVDWNLEIPFGRKGGWLTVGKQKEGVGLEYVSPGTQGMYMERSTGSPMLVRQRNVGIRYSNSVLQQHMTYTIGFFNNYWETGKSFSDNGSQITARVTGLPIYKSDREMIHLGVAYRYTTATNGQLTYKAKPEANTAPSFINTGAFDANRSNTIMLESYAAKGPFSLLAEYMHTVVKSDALQNPNLGYWQIGGSWFITGENRRYNKMTGNPGKLIPRKNFKLRKGSGWGAFELASRYTHTSANDALLTGGRFNRFTTALSWYPNAHFRYQINYGIGNLNRNDKTGNVNFWQFRVQFEL